MTKLRQWLKDRGITQTALAAAFGLPQSVICRVANGDRQPSGDILAKIWVVTKGELKPTDFFDVQVKKPEPKKRRRKKKV